MFEKSFLPFVKENWLDIVNNAIQDPLDQCMTKVFEDLKNSLQEFDHGIEKFHDFELHANRRPKVSTKYSQFQFPNIVTFILTEKKSILNYYFDKHFCLFVQSILKISENINPKNHCVKLFMDLGIIWTHRLLTFLASFSL